MITSTCHGNGGPVSSTALYSIIIVADRTDMRLVTRQGFTPSYFGFLAPGRKTRRKIQNYKNKMKNDLVVALVFSSS